MINLEEAVGRAKSFLEKSGVLFPMLESALSEPFQWVLKFRAIAPHLIYIVKITKENGEIESIESEPV